MKGPYLEQHELEQLEVLLPHAIRDTLRGWKSTRLSGGSESMAFYGNISNSLLKAFDELAAEIKPQPKPVQFKCTVIDDAHPNGIPLEQWASPPQRTWVVLTEAEIHNLRLIEAKRKESAQAAHDIKEKNT